jgi:hypothetical protein
LKSARSTLDSNGLYRIRLSANDYHTGVEEFQSWNRGWATERKAVLAIGWKALNYRLSWTEKNFSTTSPYQDQTSKVKWEFKLLRFRAVDDMPIRTFGPGELAAAGMRPWDVERYLDLQRDLAWMIHGMNNPANTEADIAHHARLVANLTQRLILILAQYPGSHRLLGGKRNFDNLVYRSHIMMRNEIGESWRLANYREYLRAVERANQEALDLQIQRLSPNERMDEVLKRAGQGLRGAAAEQFKELFKPKNIALILALVGGFGALHATAFGPALDLLLWAYLGHDVAQSALEAFEALIAARKARTQKEIDDSARTIRRLVTGLAVNLGVGAGARLAAPVVAGSARATARLFIPTGRASSAERAATALSKDQARRAYEKIIRETKDPDIRAAAQRALEALNKAACFVAGTPLLTPTGAKAIELFKPGDLVLSRSESDPEGPVSAKEVLATLVRVTLVFDLHLPGRVIKTTAEHPFFVLGRGWVPAGELRQGDLLVSHEGIEVPVEAIGENGQVTTVYNLAVADYHTYFVGSQEWGFSVWAHNSTPCFEAKEIAPGFWGVYDNVAKKWVPPDPSRPSQLNWDKGVAERWKTWANNPRLAPADRAETAKLIADHSEAKHLWDPSDRRFKNAGVDTRAKFEAQIDKVLEHGEAKLLKKEGGDRILPQGGHTEWDDA